MVGHLALVEVYVALLAVPDQHVTSDSVLSCQAVGEYPAPVHDEAMLAMALVGLTGVVQVSAAIVVVGVPEPHVVQHHVVAVDLHHDIRAHNGAAAVGEGADAHENVGDHPGATGQSVLLAHLCAPQQQRSHRLAAHGCAGLQQQARDSRISHAVGHLDGGPPFRGNERGQADAQDDEAVLLHLDRGLELVYAGRHQEPLHPLHALVDLIGSHPRPGDEDLVLKLELGPDDASVGTNNAADKLRHVDVPDASIQHQEWFLGTEGLRHGDDLSRRLPVARALLLWVQAAHAHKNVVPASWARHLAPNVYIPEEPLLLRAHGQIAVHNDVRHEAAGGVLVVVRQAQTTLDDAPPNR
mmetsp:Transcript_67586/g.187432  ORF Transcript_67586/g.187432 Transcript_67586/m.187432 type:complete len:354 (+) Transcript_67586:852-1913(+)